MRISNWKITLLAIMSLLMVVPVQARVKRTVGIVKGWRLTPEYGMVDTIRVDTSWINTPMRNLQNDYSIANTYNGNAISPIQAKVYFDRDGNGMQSGLVRPRIDFVFEDGGYDDKQ